MTEWVSWIGTTLFVTCLLFGTPGRNGRLKLNGDLQKEEEK